VCPDCPGRAPAPAADLGSLTSGGKPALLKVLATRRLDGITADGDQQALATLLGLLDTPDKEFPIVTP
jgi:alkyl sulfatase BDS1-like metallo-beta-lactamase superfamily hydrolase